jgi:hypothetical protein
LETFSSLHFLISTYLPPSHSSSSPGYTFPLSQSNSLSLEPTEIPLLGSPIAFKHHHTFPTHTAPCSYLCTSTTLTTSVVSITEIMSGLSKQKLLFQT